MNMQVYFMHINPVFSCLVTYVILISLLLLSSKDGLQCNFVIVNAVKICCGFVSLSVIIFLWFVTCS